MSKRLEIQITAPLPDDAFASIDRQNVLMDAAKKFRDEIEAGKDGVTFEVKIVTVKGKPAAKPGAKVAA